MAAPPVNRPLTNFGVFLHFTDVIAPAKYGFEKSNGFGWPTGLKMHVYGLPIESLRSI
jgi:hypothetical protein